MMLCTFIGASTDTFFSSTVGTTTAAAYGDVFVETSLLANGDGGGGGIVGGGGVVTEEDAAGKGGGVMGGGIVGKDGGVGVDEETHRKMVLFGVILSVVSMSLVSHFVKKELYKVNKRKMMMFRRPPRDVYVFGPPPTYVGVVRSREMVLFFVCAQSPFANIGRPFRFPHTLLTQYSPPPPPSQDIRQAKKGEERR